MQGLQDAETKLQADLKEKDASCKALQVLVLALMHYLATPTYTEN